MRQFKPLALILAVLSLAMPATVARGGDLDEFKIKREAVFEFARKPVVSGAGDRITITFETRGFCDVTVAVEKDSGRIVRHLAAGVLGENAPAPFARSAKRQTIVWDGKNDAGRYIDNRSDLRVRVSLGLKPRFERTLYWSPKRRASSEPPIIRATPKGVYVYDSGQSLDHVRFFGHDGKYVRTVYPMPAGKIGGVRGLFRHTFPQDGRTLPLKCNFLQTTMLTGGTNCSPITYKPKSKTFESVVAGYPNHFGMSGRAARGMAVHAKTGVLALGFWKLNRLGTDGGGVGSSIYGPKTGFPARLRLVHSFPGGVFDIGPRSLAFSPDGRWLYLAGYVWAQPWNNGSLHGVLRMRIDSDDPPELFAGSMKQGDWGTDASHLSVPTSVTCDAKGRVYVTDHMNDRIQVFDASGKLLKSIPAVKPVKLCIDPKTGELYVFSWMIGNDRLVRENQDRLKRHLGRIRIPVELRKYGPFENPKLGGTWPLPVRNYVDRVRSSYGTATNGTQFRGEIDFHADPMTIWYVPDRPRRQGPSTACILLMRIDGKKLRIVRDFGKNVAANPTVDHHAGGIRQRLYVNPRTGRLYVANGTSFQDVTRIDPVTGRTKRVKLPFNSEEMAFDRDGLAYLRSMSFVARYDTRTWQEIPWDYGEEKTRLSFSSMSWARAGSAESALPVYQGINWHMGGMHVSPRGHLAVAGYVAEEAVARTDQAEALEEGKPYSPQIYPGRALGHKRALIHVWDERGKLIIQDAVPGLPDLYGLGIDREDGIYVLSSMTRSPAGKRYYNDMTGTLLKFRPHAGRVLSVGKGVPVPLKEATRPDRPIDGQSALQGRAWVQGAQWQYGGVGYCGKNRGVGCSCYNTRFALDDFGRSFAPEMDRYQVAVLDTAGNLILRIGDYGNVDDGTPLVAAGGPPHTKSIGGDEVALFHGAYVATDTDRRLFIADPGNARIVSVKLGYHKTERVTLNGATEGGP